MVCVLVVRLLRDSPRGAMVTVAWPASPAPVAELVPTFTSYVVAGLRFLYDDTTFSAFPVSVFCIQKSNLMLGTLTIVFGVHTLFTKLVVAQRTLERDIIDHWDQTVATFCRAHLQVRIIRGEVKFSDLLDQVFLPVCQRLIKQGFLVHFDILTVLLRTFWRNK